MAFTDLGSLGATGAATANQSALTLTTTAAIAVGDLVVVAVAVDNVAATADADGLEVGFISDTGGNRYNYAGGWSNNNAGAQAGASIHLFYTIARFAVSSGQNIAATFTTATTSDATALVARKFSVGAGKTVQYVGSAVTQSDAAAHGSLDLVTPSETLLRIRAIAGEIGNNTSLTATSGWTAWANGNSATTGTTAAQCCRAEHHISAGTGDASNPSWGTTWDTASIYAAFREIDKKAYVVQSAVAGSATQVKTLTVPLGVTATAGNLLVGFVFPDKIITSFDVPSGWTGPVQSHVAGTLICGAMFYKISDGTESGATFTFVSAANAWIVGSVMEIAGITPSSPLDQSGENDNNAAIAKTITVTAGGATSLADEFVVSAWACDSRSSIGVFNPVTNQFDVVAQNNSLGGSTSAPGLQVATKLLTATGTPAVTYSYQGGSNEGFYAIIATFKVAQFLRPTLLSSTNFFGAATISGGAAYAQRTLLGHAESTADSTTYTFNTGFTLQTGKIAVAVGGRSATALAINSLTIAGVTATARKSDTNNDVSGNTRAAIYEATLSSVPNNDIVVTFSSTSVRCGIDVYLLTNTGTVFDSASGVQDGAGVGLSTTINTPDRGVTIGVAYMTNVNSNHRMAAASAQSFVAQTALAVATANGGAAGINWTGLTEDAGTDVLLEGGTGGDEVLIVVSWNPVDYPQPLTATRFTSTNFFGTPVVTQSGGTQTLTPTKFDSTNFFGTAVVGRGAAPTVVPALLTSANTFGAAVVGRGAVTLSPTKVSSTNFFGTPVVTQGAVTLVPTLFTEADIFGTAVVGRGPAPTITPSKLTSTNSFGTPIVGRGLTATRFDSTNSFGTPVVGRGAVTLAPTKLTSTNSFGTPVVGRGAAPTITPAKVSSTNFFGTAVVGRGAAPTITPTKLSSTNFFGHPIVSIEGGPQVVAPARLDSTNFFGAAVVGRGAITLSPTKLTSTNSFGSPIVGRGLKATLFTDADIFGSPDVGVPAAAVHPTLYVSPNSFGAAVVGRGPITLSPTVVQSTNTFGSPEVRPVYTLSPTLYVDPNTFYNATITSGDVILVPTLFSSVNVFYHPRIMVVEPPDLTVGGEFEPAPTLLGSTSPSPELVGSNTTEITLSGST